MKSKTLILLALSFTFSPAFGWSMLEPVNETCKKKWEKVDPLNRGEIEAKLLGFGLSSTGKIKIQNIYSLTHNSKLGNKGDKIAMFIQEDLFGSRLFWVVLVNIESQKMQLIYKPQTQKMQNKAQ